MKNVFLSLCFFISLYASSQQGRFIIKGTSDVKDGIAILNDYNQPDTVKIVNGKFSFTGKIGKPNLISISVPPALPTRIIIEPGTITVDYRDHTYIMGGAPLNVRFQKIEDALKPINDRIKKYWSQYNKTEGEEHIRIWRLYNQAMIDKREKTMELVTADKTFAGFVECLPEIHYESAANIKLYLDEFNFLKDDPRYKPMEKYYEGVARTADGVTPPDWTLSDPKGNVITLSSLKGKYVLIDFWYSGCHWCRKMTPGLKNIYHDLKNKGFEIVSVSVDPPKDEDKWRKAMEEDDTPWLEAWDSAKTLPDQYSVQGYPTMFFVGPDGKVLRRIYGYHDEQILREFFESDMNGYAAAVSRNKKLNNQ